MNNIFTSAETLSEDTEVPLQKYKLYKLKYRVLMDSDYEMI